MFTSMGTPLHIFYAKACVCSTLRSQLTNANAVLHGKPGGTHTVVRPFCVPAHAILRIASVLPIRAFVHVCKKRTTGEGDVANQSQNTSMIFIQGSIIDILSSIVKCHTMKAHQLQCKQLSKEFSHLHKWIH